MDDEQLKKLGGGSYWKELLDRIRDIRSSEKVMYRQVLDLYTKSAYLKPLKPREVTPAKKPAKKLAAKAKGGAK